MVTLKFPIAGLTETILLNLRYSVCNDARSQTTGGTSRNLL